MKKINRESVTEQIYNDLKERILSKEFSTGDKLPSENNLSEVYGVSRLSVRAALQKLKTIGFIDIRVGEGSFVQEINLENFMEEISNVIAQEDMIKYLFEFRVHTETICVKLAIDRATDEELLELSRIAENMLEVAKMGDLNRYIDCDYEFHYYLCKLSHNKLYEILYGSIKDLFKLTIRKNVSETTRLYEKNLVEIAQYHVQFAIAVQSRNLEDILRLHNNLVEVRPGLDI